LWLFQLIVLIFFLFMVIYDLHQLIDFDRNQQILWLQLPDNIILVTRHCHRSRFNITNTSHLPSNQVKYKRTSPKMCLCSYLGNVWNGWHICIEARKFELFTEISQCKADIKKFITIPKNVYPPSLCSHGFEFTIIKMLSNNQ